MNLFSATGEQRIVECRAFIVGLLVGAVIGIGIASLVIHAL